MPLRWVGVELVAAREGVEGIEWAELKLEVLVREATVVALDDGGCPLAVDEHDPSCRRRHGYETERSNRCEPATRV